MNAAQTEYYQPQDPDEYISSTTERNETYFGRKNL